MSKSVSSDASLLRLMANGRVVTAGYLLSTLPQSGRSSAQEFILQTALLSEDPPLELYSLPNFARGNCTLDPRLGIFEATPASGMNNQTPTPPTDFVQTAPAIIAGTPLDELDIYRAFMDEVNRFRLHKMNPVAVTERDVARTTLRKALVIQQHLMVLYPDRQVPQWAVDLRQKVEQCQQFQQDVQARIQQSEQRLQQQLKRIEQSVRQDIQQMQVQLTETATERQMANEELQNMQAAERRDRVLYDHFQRFAKVTPGLGKGLPGVPAPVNPVPLLRIGELVPHRFFPSTPEELFNWSHQQINTLSIMLNNDFGIERADNLDERRHKLLEYLITG